MLLRETARNRLMSCFASLLFTHCFVWYTLCFGLEIMPTWTSFRLQAFFLVHMGITHSIICLILVHSLAILSFPLCFSSGLSTYKKCPSGCMCAGRRLTVPMTMPEIHIYPFYFIVESIIITHTSHVLYWVFTLEHLHAYLVSQYLQRKPNLPSSYQNKY